LDLELHITTSDKAEGTLQLSAFERLINLVDIMNEKGFILMAIIIRLDKKGVVDVSMLFNHFF
jgi:hypothetical protein